MSKTNIESNYSRFYSRKQYTKVYPTEFVVRIFLSNYPGLKFTKPAKNDSILDVGFGDGRNTAFLCDLGLDVYGVEIADEIVSHVEKRMECLGHNPTLRVGRNSMVPFKDERFDYILACHSCYYCDENQTIADNIKEYARVLKPKGWLIASLPDLSSYIFKNSQKLEDGTSKILDDPYNNRNGYRLHGFEDEQAINFEFSKTFENISLGRARNDYFGIDERVFWIVCRKI